jgi:hypothetical protein
MDPVSLGLGAYGPLRDLYKALRKFKRDFPIAEKDVKWLQQCLLEYKWVHRLVQERLEEIDEAGFIDCYTYRDRQIMKKIAKRTSKVKADVDKFLKPFKDGLAAAKEKWGIFKYYTRIQLTRRWENRKYSFDTFRSIIQSSKISAHLVISVVQMRQYNEELIMLRRVIGDNPLTVSTRIKQLMRLQYVIS